MRGRGGEGERKGEGEGKGKREGKRGKREGVWGIGKGGFSNNVGFLPP